MLGSFGGLSSPARDGTQAPCRKCRILTTELPANFQKINNSVYGFPGCSDGKESACNMRNTGSIPGSGRSPFYIDVISLILQ